MSKIKVCLTFSEYNNPMQIYEAEMMGTYRDGAGVETVVFFRDGADECEHLPIEHIQEFLFADKWIKANFEL